MRVIGRSWTAALLSPLASFLLLSAGGPGQVETVLRQASQHFVAFRFDESRVIAVLEVLDDARSPRAEGVSKAPAAQFGFPYFDAPAALRAHVPAALQSTPWVVHAAPRRALAAHVEKVVGGNARCQEAAAVLLAIAPTDLETFKSVTQHYFVAEANASPRAGGSRQTNVREAAVALTADQRQSLASLLDGVLKREWPSIRKETESELSRMAASEVGYHRTWASERRALDQELSQGQARLSYDVQAFHLDPTGAVSYYVRAEWLAKGRQAFAATLWLRGDAFDVVETNVGPASWLRMFEFQGKVGRLQLGLVLNVLDHDGDGWGEVVFAQGGYESLAIEVREYSKTGFAPATASFTSGC